ncbi:Uncharacterised protein [Mycobacteroides abscessus]|nr:Uncharacterised protein [Mycobacteroides abscessus]
MTKQIITWNQPRPSSHRAIRRNAVGADPRKRCPIA